MSYELDTIILRVNQILIEDYEFLSEMMVSRLGKYEKVVVLGCTGMLGYYLTSIFALHYSKQKPTEDGAVIGVSRKVDAKTRNLELDFPITFRRVDFDSLDAELASDKKILVIHAASPSSIQSVTADPLGAVETNILMTIRIAKHVEKIGGHIVFLSSGEVYGDTARVPTKEIDYSPINHLETRGTYPELKRAGEVILQSFCKSNENFSATSLRVFHTFGPGIDLNDPRIFGLVCNSIYRKQEISLNTDGSSLRVFMYSRDLMSSILHTIGEKGFNFYNVAGKDPISIAEFCQLSIPLGVPSLSFKNEKDETPRNPQIGFANTEKIESLGWVASVKTFEALQRTSKSLEV